ncbi:MAG TPA: diacylglycerol kinase family protein [Croceibacterium sp.]|nr:diacylglycerol kinase family protein [Croceibacterium sp.]
MVRDIWLVNNASSGSNDDAALDALDACCGENGLRVARRTVFPEQALPTPQALDAAGIGLVAVFAGDGTINSLITALAGWGGALLVLPGGTMNLLFHRLHGDHSLEEVVALVAQGEATVRRPSVIRCAHGNAYAGLLAGPGTSWGRVREAMRETAVVELAESTVAAINETLSGEMIACVAPRLGRPEGYPLLCLEPGDDAIDVVAYHAESAGEYLEQAWALVRRNFRDGPHELLGRTRTLRLASTEGKPFGLLIDGEQAEAEPEVEFALARAEVDLVATRRNGS